MYSNSVNDASTNIKIRVVSDNNPGHLIIDEMQCTSYSTGAATPSYVPGYSNLLVSSTSSAVTGLVGNTTYYFRVRAVGADASCVSSSDPDSQECRKDNQICIFSVYHVICLRTSTLSLTLTVRGKV